MNLTPVSFIVLGLIELAKEATPYDLKQATAISVGHFWAIQHAQFYSEPERLASAGLLKVTIERGGRRRKRYSLTARGRKELERWRAEPTDQLPQLRDLGLLKLFFGAEPTALAEVQLEAHGARLTLYEEMIDRGRASAPAGALAALEAGIAAERTWVEFWTRLAA